MDRAPSIESVAEAFYLWRQTRARKGRIPAPLRARAVAPLRRRPAAEIASDGNVIDRSKRQFAHGQARLSFFRKVIGVTPVISMG